MKNKHFLYLFLLFVLGTAFTLTDDEPMKKFYDRFQGYLRERPTEKVFLHTDKPYYAAGDTLWLKAYLVDGIVHQADSISRPLYIRLTDEDGKLIEKKIIRLENGYGFGNFALTDSLAEGNYQITAFTNWMRNQPEEYFFRKNFSVFSPSITKKKEEVEAPVLADLQFFPEGGYWIQGIRAKVGFKATDQNGKGINIQGGIYEAGSNEPTLQFKTETLGMGSVFMIPKAGKKYVAKVEIDGKSKSFELPETRSEGVTMTIGNLLPDNIKIQLANNFSADRLATETYYLVAHIRGIVRFINQVPATLDKTFYIPRSKIQEAGVLTFTLFDKNFNPVAERLAFNNIDKQTLKVSITADKAEYSPRELVKLDVSVTDAQDKPVSGSFSMAATSGNQILDANLFTDNILSSFLLTSDLRGTIEQPAIYFDKSNDNAALQLDNLMLTQGWRRFAWKDLASTETSQNGFERGLNIKGRLQGAKKLSAKSNVSLILEGSGGNSFLNTGVNPEGEFMVQNVDFEGTARLGLKGIDGKAPGTAQLLLQGLSVVTPRLTKIPFMPYQLSRAELNNFLTKAATKSQVNDALNANLEKKEQNKSKKEEKSDKNKTDVRRAVYGTPDFTLEVTETMVNGIASIPELIRGRLPGVVVGSSGDILIRGVGSLNGSNEPLKMIDGIPADWGGLNLNDVEAIDLLKGASTSLFGSRGANGVLNLLTKRTKQITNDGDEGKNGYIKGFAVVKEFYVPRYTTPKRANALPDFRSTIYWNPYITVGESGKTSLSFYNSDEKTTIKVNLQGMNPKGGIGVGAVQYLVK